MGVHLVSLPVRAGVVACLLGLLSAASAAEQMDGTPRWRLSLEAIALVRFGGADRTLVERVPGTVPFNATFTTPGTEAFNSNQFQQGVFAGPKISLLYRSDAATSVEISYFSTASASASSTIGPDSPADWLVMRAPGAFWQT